MPNHSQKTAIIELVRINKLYEDLDEIRQEAFFAAVPIMASVIGLDIDTFIDLIQEEIFRQRYLRGLCKHCAEKTSQSPNICVQCSMRIFNERGNIPRHNWMSPN